MSVADWSQMSKSWRMCDGGVLLAQSSHDAVHPERGCRQSPTTPMNATPQPLPPASVQRLQVDVAFVDVFLLRFSLFFLYV